MKGERISTTEVELADCPTVGLTLGEQTEGGGETEINDDGGGGGGGGDYDDDDDDDLGDDNEMSPVQMKLCPASPGQARLQAETSLGFGNILLSRFFFLEFSISFGIWEIFLSIFFFFGVFNVNIIASVSLSFHNIS